MLVLRVRIFFDDCDVLVFMCHVYCGSWQDGRGGLQAHFLGFGRAGERLNNPSGCPQLVLFFFSGQVYGLVGDGGRR